VKPDEFDLALATLFRARTHDGAGAIVCGPPASADQIAALERHWGRPLPSLYRRLLAKHNGVSRLWFDVALLSIGTIIDGSCEMRAFEATAPDHWRWIFACGTESRDALAFDPFLASDDGELPVVHLGEDGVVARWPSLAPPAAECARPKVLPGYRYLAREDHLLSMDRPLSARGRRDLAAFARVRHG